MPGDAIRTRHLPLVPVPRPDGDPTGAPSGTAMRGGACELASADSQWELYRNPPSMHPSQGTSESPPYPLAFHQ